MSTAPDLQTAARRAETARGSRLSALLYEPLLARGERAGMAKRRAALLSRARGAVLEIGAGTGLNLAHYPAHLERIVLCEPEKHMARQLSRRVQRLALPAEVVRAPAEMIPFEQGTFDTVVATLVFCTVADPRPCLQEIRRVLRVDGSLLFLEHVRSQEPRLARWQDRLQRPWQLLADGCHCNRPTVQMLREQGYAVTVSEEGSWHKMPPVVRPLVAGSARPSS